MEPEFTRKSWIPPRGWYPRLRVAPKTKVQSNKPTNQQSNNPTQQSNNPPTHQPNNPTTQQPNNQQTTKPPNRSADTTTRRHPMMRPTGAPGEVWAGAPVGDGPNLQKIDARVLENRQNCQTDVISSCPLSSFFFLEKTAQGRRQAKIAKTRNHGELRRPK